MLYKAKINGTCQPLYKYNFLNALLKRPWNSPEIKCLPAMHKVDCPEHTTPDRVSSERHSVFLLSLLHQQSCKMRK